MGKTRHSKIRLKVPSGIFTAKKRKEYQDNERPKNKPGSVFSKYGVDGVFREDQVIGHQSNGRIKRLYNRILRKKIGEETKRLIDDD